MTGGVSMDEQMLTSVALTLATKTAEGLAEGSKAAITALVEFVRERFRGHAAEALSEAEADPTETRIESLRAALAEAAEEDPEFADELRARWQRLSLAAEDGGVVNNLSGSVSGNVVQARDIQGGITFGDVAPRRPSPDE